MQIKSFFQNQQRNNKQINKGDLAKKHLMKFTTIVFAVFIITFIFKPDMVAKAFHFSLPDKPITDMKVVISEKSYNDDCPYGYYPVIDGFLATGGDGDGTPMDFTQGTGGDYYVYVCYTRGPLFSLPNYTSDAITGITAVIGGSDVACPTGYSKVQGYGAADGDLNDGAGGDYIFLCTTKSTAAGFNYLLNLEARWNWSDLNPFAYELGYEEWDYIGQNLNDSLDVPTHIWLGYQTTNAVADSRDCGGYGESPCTVDTNFYWQNGSGSCDRGLREWGGECVNGLSGRARFQKGDLENEWYIWALNNQRHGIALDEPLNWYSQVGTHNSNNNNTDGYTDPNQWFSMSDQLNAGARFLAIDGVYFADAYRLVHCEPDGGGCSAFDRLFYAGIKEINDWLEAHPGEVIYLLLEDRGERSPIHLQLDLSIFGDKLYTEKDRASVLTECKGLASLSECIAGKPEGNYDGEYNEGEYRWPTIREMQATGKQVFVIGSNQADVEPGHFDNDNNNDIKAMDVAKISGDCSSFQPMYSTDYTRIDAVQIYPQGFSRIEEARPTIHLFSWTGLLTEEDVNRAALCNISRISLDMLASKSSTASPICLKAADEQRGDIKDYCGQEDNRVQASIWSWAENQPVGWDSGSPGINTAVLQRSDGRWESRNPEEYHRFACAAPREGAPIKWVYEKNSNGEEEWIPTPLWRDIQGFEWKVTQAAGKWEQGWLICHDEFGENYTFAAPVNGFSNSVLQFTALAGDANSGVWVNMFFNPTANNTLAGNWVQNRRPQPTINVSTNNIPEGSVLSVDSVGTDDQDGHSLTYAWDFGDTTTSTEANPGQHVYADNGVYTITLKVTDEIGAFVTARQTITVTNANPTVDAGPDFTISEGQTAELDPISFSDPGTLDTHTVSVNWGEGTTTSATVTETPYGPPGSTAGLNGTATAQHTYGDNGLYVVTVCAKDDDNGQGCDTINITVDNLDPILTLDKSAAITFAEGDALLGRRGVNVDMRASIHDEGSDDLTLKWSFPPSTVDDTIIFYNDGATPDPAQSPGPVFPVDIVDNLSANFDLSGVYNVTLDLNDDDGGTANDGLPLLITDSRTCTKDFPFWYQQFTGNGGRALIDEARLQGYLDVIRFASSFFDETNLLTTADAEALLKPGNKSALSGPAIQMALTAWLNFASGGALWDENIPRLGEPFYETINRIDSNLSAGINHNQIINDAEAINALHPGTRCGDAGKAELNNILLVR